MTILYNKLFKLAVYSGLEPTATNNHCKDFSKTFSETPDTPVLPKAENF